MKRLLLFTFLLITITACTPDPRREADAYATRVKADQEALTQEQERQQDEELHDMQVRNLEVDTANREETAAEWRYGWNIFIRVFFLFFTASVCYFLFRFSRTMANAAQGIAMAAVHSADLRANLIYLDKETGQFPLIKQHIHGNRYALHNPNTQSVLMLDVTNPSDRQLIATSGITQYVGVLAQHAARSKDPTGMAMINPPIVHAQDKTIVIGAEFLKDAIPLPNESQS